MATKTKEDLEPDDLIEKLKAISFNKRELVSEKQLIDVLRKSADSEEIEFLFDAWVEAFDNVRPEFVKGGVQLYLAALSALAPYCVKADNPECIYACIDPFVFFGFRDDSRYRGKVMAALEKYVVDKKLNINLGALLYQDS